MDDHTNSPGRVKDVADRLRSFADADLLADPVAGVINPRVIADLRGLSPDAPDEFLNELIDLFLSDAVTYLGQVAEALESGNAVMIRKTAHALKSSSGNLGAEGMSEICRSLEESAGQEPADWTKITDRADLLSAEAGRVRRVLRGLRSPSPS